MAQATVRILVSKIKSETSTQLLDNGKLTTFPSVSPCEGDSGDSALVINLSTLISIWTSS